MRTLVTDCGPFDPGLFTVLALARHLPDFDISFSKEAPAGTVLLRTRIDPLSANVSCQLRPAIQLRVDGTRRMNGLPFGTAGLLWRQLELDLCQQAARSVGVATLDWEGERRNYDRYNGAIALSLICEQVDRTLISGLDLYDPEVRRIETGLGSVAAPRQIYDVHARAPKYERTAFDAKIGKGSAKILVDDFVGELLDLRREQSGRLWRGSWEKSIAEFSHRAWSILQSHVKAAVVRHWGGISAEEISEKQREIEDAVRASLNRGYPSIH